MQQALIIPHLFRTEFSKICSVLIRHFGLGNMQLAEDIASETFLQAMESWPYQGLPVNPVAWLYTVAKNKTSNYLQRDRLFDDTIVKAIAVNENYQYPEIDLSEPNIGDSQLQMLFTLCHPAIAREAQIGLSLRILCGFGIEEIANAFLTNKETINKRLYRAKEKLRQEKVEIAIPTPDILPERLDAVLATLYLLFNEGYYSESREEIIRQELCTEAMRLLEMLITYPPTHLPKVNALYALMCFQASRLQARKGIHGELLLYDEQDEKLWDAELIKKAAFHLKQASVGNQLSAYHLEAAIAYWHTQKTDEKVKWENILQLYNQLLQLQYSPVAALNRTYALSKARGCQMAIEAAEKLALYQNAYYQVLMGELYTAIDHNKAAEHFRQALRLVKTNAEKALIMKKLDRLNHLDSSSSEA